MGRHLTCLCATIYLYKNSLYSATYCTAMQHQFDLGWKKRKCSINKKISSTHLVERLLDDINYFFGWFNHTASSVQKLKNQCIHSKMPCLISSGDHFN